MPSSDIPTDGSIIDDVLSGQTERFAEIVRRYQSALSRVAMSRLGRAELADEVTQETFLCAFKSLASYDSRFSFRTWLWTILLNQCRRAFQKGQRSPQVNTWIDAVGDADLDHCRVTSSDDAATPPLILLAKERAEQVEQLLADLPEREADALRLRFYGGLKFHEIADAMSCSLSTAKNRVRWGLMKMSERLLAGEIQ